MKTTYFSLLFSAVLSAPLLANGLDQSIATPAPTSVSLPTWSSPPPGFDPVSGSDDELTIYGFPPRPDAATAPKAYAAWHRAMTAARTRIVPVLKATNVTHGRMQNAQRSVVVNGTASSYNWSGYVVTNTATSYSPTSYDNVFTDFFVPVANQAFGACDATYSANWVGLDGFTGNGASELLQAGTDSDSICSASGTTTVYYAWVEWFPYGEMMIQNFPISPGDDMYVQVWANSNSNSQGYASLVNLTTGVYSPTIALSAPGYALVGNSAEWVLERPYVNGNLSLLTNYADNTFWDCIATAINGSLGYLGLPSATAITMYDANNAPISLPTAFGNSAVGFQNLNSSRWPQQP